MVERGKDHCRSPCRRFNPYLVDGAAQKHRQAGCRPCDCGLKQATWTSSALVEEQQDFFVMSFTSSVFLLIDGVRGGKRAGLFTCSLTCSVTCTIMCSVTCVQSRVLNHVFSHVFTHVHNHVFSHVFNHMITCICDVITL